MTFCLRRCREHSRSPRCRNREPSPKTWTSTWCACSTNRSRYTSPWPKAAAASAWALGTTACSSSGVLTMRMPRPPPPAAALTATGYPMVAATSRASCTPATGPSEPGTVGTPAWGGGGAARSLPPQRAPPRGRRPDEGHPRLVQTLGEVRPLGEEAVPRVNGVGADLRRCRQYRVDVQVAAGSRGRPDHHSLVRDARVQRLDVGLAADRDRRGPEFPGGPHDPDGDLAAVGDQEFAHRIRVRRWSRWHPPVPPSPRCPRRRRRGCRRLRP